jgi:RHS repeat-associated protein
MLRTGLTGKGGVTHTYNDPAHTHDGNGVLLKKVVGSTTTIYIGNYYEKTGSTIRKYYYFAGQRVAMRDGSTVYYLVTDHVGSTSKTLTSSGGVIGELRYKAYGEIRYTSGTTPTNYRFTGQFQEASINLYIMGARWYDPYVARWTSPDTLVPNTTTVLYKVALLADNGGSTKPLEG